MSLLEKALRKGNYELAAKTIVYGMLKVIHDRKEAEKCAQGQPERPEVLVDSRLSLPYPDTAIRGHRIAAPCGCHAFGSQLRLTAITGLLHTVRRAHAHQV
ncbi:MAG: hypothetical protein WC169_11640 [Dehalococcoidia bacterium]|jgi:hypothetical protein